MQNKKRCSWVNENNPIYVKYHDCEWGKESHGDEYLFEMLVLESFQAGLSWECVLNKREAFRELFLGFYPQAVSKFDESDIERLMADKRIIRIRRKITAAVNNASVFLKIQEEFGSFDRYIWSFTEGKRVINRDGVTRATSPLSDRISADLKKRGMSFVGSTIIYSYLQAVGIIGDHESDCFLSDKKTC